MDLILAWTPFDPWHLLVLGMVALLLFGKRLPEVGRSLGKGIAEFKKGLRDVREELNREEPEPPDQAKLRPPERDYDNTPRLREYDAAARVRSDDAARVPSEPRVQAEPHAPADVPQPGDAPRTEQ
ncbi:MAG: twin-arginine translocase TatA/TatE family subunit [Planctomycetota bacterium]